MLGGGIQIRVRVRVRVRGRARGLGVRVRLGARIRALAGEGGCAWHVWRRRLLAGGHGAGSRTPVKGMGSGL